MATSTKPSKTQRTKQLGKLKVKNLAKYEPKKLNGQLHNESIEHVKKKAFDIKVKMKLKTGSTQVMR